MPRSLIPSAAVVSQGLPHVTPVPAPAADPLRPSFTALAQTNSSSPFQVDAVTFALPLYANVEVTALVEAQGAVDAAVFYIHAAYQRAGGGPVALSYVSNQDNSASTYGATAWTAVVSLDGNNVILTVQEPGGNPVKWTVEVQYTIGQS